jgi:hypothetical protein
MCGCVLCSARSPHLLLVLLQPADQRCHTTAHNRHNKEYRESGIKVQRLSQRAAEGRSIYAWRSAVQISNALVHAGHIEGAGSCEGLPGTASRHASQQTRMPAAVCVPVRRARHRRLAAVQLSDKAEERHLQQVQKT